MGSGLISHIEIETEYLIVFLFMIQILLFILLISVHMKYNRLKRIIKKFEQIDRIARITKKNEESIRKINKKIKKNYQKVGIIRYDAFQEMGGKLSFALTMLDEEDSGWILNSMHSREGCYTYVKEIVKGESYIELSEEEKDSLEHAIFQEAYDIKDINIRKLK